MKYAVIGTGKTGQAVLDMLPKQDVVAVCNSRNPVTLEILHKCDTGIVFVAGKSFGDILPLLLESKIPLVIGTTGYAWPENLDAELRAANTPWIIGQSFSLGLNVMRYFAEQIQQSLDALVPQQIQMGMSETHHIHKLDAPSGTALYLAKALHFPREKIDSIREGDVKGTHTISFNLQNDRILLTHEAIDRAAFAEGVIQSCEYIKNLSAGLHFCEQLMDVRIRKAVREHAG